MNSAAPFLKWAGGKRQLLPVLRDAMPKRFGRYYEPFLGGGALFFDRRPEPAVLSDANRRLVRTYRAVKEHVEELIRTLDTFEGHTTEADFYIQRARSGMPAKPLRGASAQAQSETVAPAKCGASAQAPKQLSLPPPTIDDDDDVALAAWFIYLNRTGYNGLYRVNSANQFNVPWGRKTKVALFRAEILRACSRALATAELRIGDFAAAVHDAVAGDFVYFDPPYVPLNLDSFTAYDHTEFGLPEQQRLASLAAELVERGVHVMLSNSWTPTVQELYAAPCFELVPVSARRSINSKGEGRGEIDEALILGRRKRVARKRRSAETA